MERMTAAGRLGPPLAFLSGVPAICNLLNRKDSKFGMVGLEYIVELVGVSRNDPAVSYECVLCLKSLATKATAVYHVVNYVHKVNYLRSHFPLSLEPLLPYMQMGNGKWHFKKPQARNALRHICWRIEERFGRPVPAMIRLDHYLKMKAQYVRKIEDGPHFEEDVPVPLLDEFYQAIPGATANVEYDRMGDQLDAQQYGYDDYGDEEQPLDDPADERHAEVAPSLSVTVSTGNSKSSSAPSVTVEQVPSHSAQKQASPPTSSSDPAAAASANTPITAELYANYKRQLDKASVELQAKLLKYETKPEFHPLYPGEWKTFWSRRSAELHEEGKDTTDYDFSADWTRFWLVRVIELNEEELERADRRIRRELNLPLSGPIVEPAPVVAEPTVVAKRSAPPTQPATATADRSHSRDRDRRKREQIADERRAKSPDRRRTEKGGNSSSSNHIKRSGHTDRDRSPAGRGKDYNSERSTNRQESSKTSATSRDHRQSSTSTNNTTKRSTLSHLPPVEPVSDEDNLPTAADLNLDDLEVTNEPVTVISVLRLLSAFEDLLGSSLGPRVVDLLSKAVALEKVKANLADELLMSAENSVLLDTVKEKLKGLLLAGVVEHFKVKSVRKVIAHVNSITKIIDKQTKLKEEQNMAEARLNMERLKEQERLAEELRKQREAEQKKRDEAESRALVMKQLATSITLQGKMITKEQLEALTDVYIQNHSADDTPYLFGLQMGSRFPDLKEDTIPEVPAPAPQAVQEFPDQHPMLWNAHHQPPPGGDQQYGQYGGTQYNAPQQPLYNSHGFYNNQQPIQQQQQQQQQQQMTQQQQQHIGQQQHSNVNMRPNLSEVRLSGNSSSRRQRRDDQPEIQQTSSSGSYERRVTLPYGQQQSSKTGSNGNRYAQKSHDHQRGSGHRPSSGSRSRTSQAANGGGGYTSGSSSNSYSGGGTGSGSRSSGYY